MKIYTIIPYRSYGAGIFFEDVKSFTKKTDAEDYADSLKFEYDIVESELDHGYTDIGGGFETL
jgi:hypothetical protein